MFMGEYSHSIDEKGRVIIPAKFREELGDVFVITRGFDGCLCIYPKEEWSVIEDKLRSLPFTNKDARRITRFLVSGASTCELDRQGRIVVPATLREYADLKKEVIVNGGIGRIEIWDKARWSANSDFGDMDDIAGNLQNSGILI